MRSQRYARYPLSNIQLKRQHNKQGDLWVIIDSLVYDLSKFGAMHPGGLGVLLDEEVGGSRRLFRGFHI